MLTLVVVPQDLLLEVPVQQPEVVDAELRHVRFSDWKRAKGRLATGAPPEIWTRTCGRMRKDTHD